MCGRIFACMAAQLFVAGPIFAQLPAEAKSFANQLLGSELVAGGPPDLLVSTKTEDGLQVLVKTAGSTPYSVQVQSDNNHVAIHVGDVLFVTFESRSNSSGGGLWSMYAQHSVSPWTGYFSAQGTPSSKWGRTNVRWVSDQEIPANSMGITFHIATRSQEIEFRGFRAYNLGIYKGNLPFTPITYVGRESNAPWRHEAEIRINRYRKSDLSIRVMDAKGRPLVGKSVHVRQLRHAYEFGSFVEQPLVWQNEDGKRYRQWFLRAYNKATTPMYWADWGWENPEEHARYLQYPKWLKDHGYRIKAHVLIYPGWQFMPARVRKLENDPNALWAEMEKHIREKLAAVKTFGFVSWDVTNETRDLKDLPKSFGSEEIYVRLYKLMHEIDPSPTLYLNENTILTEGGKTDIQQAEFERMIRYLLSQGAPLQGIGMQAHFGDVLTPPTEIWRIVDRFAKFKLPIQITEFDLPIQDTQAQADYTRDLLTVWFAHPATTGFTMWGFWEGSMWQPQSRLVDREWNVRPNGQAWLDLINKRWWTDTTVVTDAKGLAKVRVFKGDYEVTAGKSVKDVTVTTPVQLSMKG